MHQYKLAFRQTENGVEAKDNYYWTCQADSYEHAVEQLRDEVENAQGEELTVYELLEISV